MRRIIQAGIFFLALVPAFSQVRSFDSIYPSLSGAEKERIYASGGLLVVSEDGPRSLGLLPPVGDIDIAAPISSRNPSFVIESLRVIPYARPSMGLLDVYNALGRISRLKGRLYHSATRDRDVPLFEDADRITIINSSKTRVVSDPPPAVMVPPSETFHVKLKDINFGNSYYQADIRCGQQGLLYSLSNFRSLTYGIIPIIKENRFITQLYIEPLTDGF
ncbi:MAG: hypothetical protein LBP42_02560, partial [Treponema sp.]|nr:hypothetical protein [Treponema sp.]